jgi:hypothetical protein
MREQIVGNRTRKERADTESFDWRKLYESVKDFLE